MKTVSTIKNFLVSQVFTVRNIFLLILIFALLGFDMKALGFLTYNLGFIAAIVLASHVFRKLLFPYLDVKVHLKSALDERNMAAGIVFFGICLVVSVLLLCSTFIWVQ